MSKKECLIKITNEVECVLFGLDSSDRQKLVDDFSVFAPNHFFNPKFKLGVWDGKLRFFENTGKTYVRLLDSIIPKIVKMGYSVNIDDTRTSIPAEPEYITENFFKDVTHPKTGKPWIMREYQVTLVNKLIEHGGGVGVAGTGAGKTGMTAALALAYEKAGNYRSVIIVPDKNLTSQTFREYANFGLDVGQLCSDHKDINKQHLVSTWQSLKNVPKLIQQFQVVIVDEAHGIRGKELTKLLNHYGKDIIFRFGVTGTIPKHEADQMAIRIAVGEVRHTIPAHDLQKQGYLAKLEIEIIQHDIDLTEQYNTYSVEQRNVRLLPYKKFKDMYFADYTTEKSYTQRNDDRLQWIADFIANLPKNTLCLVDGVQFGRKISKMVPDSYFLYGGDKMEARQEVFDMFDVEDDIKLIANVKIASTGLDIPRIFYMVGIDLGKSFVRVIQSIGRGLRKAEDKDSIKYFDICTDLKYSRKHLTDRKRYYNEARYPFTIKKVNL